MMGKQGVTRYTLPKQSFRIPNDDDGYGTTYGSRHRREYVTRYTPYVARDRQPTLSLDLKTNTLKFDSGLLLV